MTSQLSKYIEFIGQEEVKLRQLDAVIAASDRRTREMSNALQQVTAALGSLKASVMPIHRQTASLTRATRNLTGSLAEVRALNRSYLLAVGADRRTTAGSDRTAPSKPVTFRSPAADFKRTPGSSDTSGPLSLTSNPDSYLQWLRELRQGIHFFTHRAGYLRERVRLQRKLSSAHKRALQACEQEFVRFLKRSSVPLRFFVDVAAVVSEGRGGAAHGGGHSADRSERSGATVTQNSPPGNSGDDGVADALWPVADPGQIGLPSEAASRVAGLITPLIVGKMFNFLKIIRTVRFEMCKASFKHILNGKHNPLFATTLLRRAASERQTDTQWTLLSPYGSERKLTRIRGGGYEQWGGSSGRGSVMSPHHHRSRTSPLLGNLDQALERYEASLASSRYVPVYVPGTHRLVYAMKGVLTLLEVEFASMSELARQLTTCIDHERKMYAESLSLMYKPTTPAGASLERRASSLALNRGKDGSSSGSSKKTEDPSGKLDTDEALKKLQEAYTQVVSDLLDYFCRKVDPASASSASTGSAEAGNAENVTTVVVPGVDGQKVRVSTNLVASEGKQDSQVPLHFSYSPLIRANGANRLLILLDGIRTLQHLLPRFEAVVAVSAQVWKKDASGLRGSGWGDSIGTSNAVNRSRMSWLLKLKHSLHKQFRAAAIKFRHDLTNFNQTTHKHSNPAALSPLGMYSARDGRIGSGARGAFRRADARARRAESKEAVHSSTSPHGGSNGNGAWSGSTAGPARQQPVSGDPGSPVTSSSPWTQAEEPDKTPASSAVLNLLDYDLYGRGGVGLPTVMGEQSAGAGGSRPTDTSSPPPPPPKPPTSTHGTPDTASLAAMLASPVTPLPSGIASTDGSANKTYGSPPPFPSNRSSQRPQAASPHPPKGRVRAMSHIPGSALLSKRGPSSSNLLALEAIGAQLLPTELRKSLVPVVELATTNWMTVELLQMLHHIQTQYAATLNRFPSHILAGWDRYCKGTRQVGGRGKTERRGSGGDGSATVGNDNVLCEYLLTGLEVSLQQNAKSLSSKSGLPYLGPLYMLNNLSAIRRHIKEYGLRVAPRCREHFDRAFTVARREYRQAAWGKLLDVMDMKTASQLFLECQRAVVRQVDAKLLDSGSAGHSGAANDSGSTEDGDGGPGSTVGGSKLVQSLLASPEARRKVPSSLKKRIKEAFNKANKLLTDSCATQQFVAVADPSLRESLRTEALSQVLSRYEAFCGLWSRLNFTRDMGKYIKYSGKQVNGMLLRLFSQA